MGDLEQNGLYAIWDIERKLKDLFVGNLSNFKEHDNFKIRLDDGEKFYLDWVDGGYEYSLQSLIHKLLYDAGHLQRLLPEEIYDEIDDIENGWDNFLNFISLEGDDEYETNNDSNITYIELFVMIEGCLIFCMSSIFSQWDYDNSVFHPYEIPDDFCINVSFSYLND